MTPLYRPVFVLMLFASMSCDTGKLEVIQDLPSYMREVSGIETHDSTPHIWMHNDSNNKSEVYAFDQEGNMVHELDIDSANRDWEDISFDREGNLYIGDFGNNSNKRENLAVLKVAQSELLSKKDVKPERIRFKYEDQLKFPPDKERRFFDCEAMIVKDSMIYLFTKSHVRDRGGFTSLYKLPASRGNHIARKISSFEGCQDNNCKITAADYNFSTDELILLTHQSVLVFSNFEGDDFFSGDMRELAFDHISQKEGLCVVNDSIVYISDERSGGAGGNLYKFNLTKN